MADTPVEAAAVDKIAVPVHTDPVHTADIVHTGSSAGRTDSDGNASAVADCY